MIDKTEGKRSAKLLGFGGGPSWPRSLQAKVGEKPFNGDKKEPPPDDFFDTPPDDDNGNANGDGSPR